MDKIFKPLPEICIPCVEAEPAKVIQPPLPDVLCEPCPIDPPKREYTAEFQEVQSFCYVGMLDALVHKKFCSVGPKSGC